MRPRPYELELPTKATAGAVIAAAATLWKVFAWDLGEKYDEYMRSRKGPMWLQMLGVERKQDPYRENLYNYPLKLHDFTFVTREPEIYSASPLWGCLPNHAAFREDLKTVRKLRNKATHDDDVVPTLETLQVYVVAVGAVAGQADLPIAADCVALLQRINDLQTGNVVAEVDIAELLDEKESAKQQAAEYAAQVAELMQQRHAQAGNRAELQAKLDAAAEALQLAEEKARAMQDELEVQYALARKTSRDVDTSDLRPGDAWPAGAPDGRAVRLLSHVMDLYDPGADDLLSNVDGEKVVTAALAWKELVPAGDPVVLTNAGDGVALIGGTWTYLGSLDRAQGIS